MNKFKKLAGKAGSSIISEMENKFGKIRRGQEEEYTFVFFPIESNALKVHRNNRLATSDLFRSALLKALHCINFRIGGEEERDYSSIDPAEKELLDAVLAAFDPFSQEELLQLLTEMDSTSLKNPAFLMHYYEAPVKCILRLIESVDTWRKMDGPEGYFRNIERIYGSVIKQDMKMDFMIPIRR